MRCAIYPPPGTWCIPPSIEVCVPTGERITVHHSFSPQALNFNTSASRSSTPEPNYPPTTNPPSEVLSKLNIDSSISPSPIIILYNELPLISVFQPSQFCENSDVVSNLQSCTPYRRFQQCHKPMSYADSHSNVSSLFGHINFGLRSKWGKETIEY